MPTFTLGKVVGPQGPQGPQGATGPQGPQGIQGPPGIGIDTLNAPETASGSVVTFTSAAAGNPVNPLIVNIEPVQAGSGDPSPENVRPITGWTGATVTLSPTQDAADGTLYTISFGSAGTVYGGTLDVARGLLTVDRARGKLSASDLLHNTSTTFYSSKYRNTKKSSRAICENYGDKLQVHPENGFIIVYGRINSESSTAFMTRVFGDATATIDFVYKLDTPQVYQLTPQEVTTLLGTNNLWADCGDISATYRTGTDSPVMTADDVGVAGGAASYSDYAALEARVAALEAALANS